MNSGIVEPERILPDYGIENIMEHFMRPHVEENVGQPSDEATQNNGPEWISIRVSETKEAIPEMYQSLRLTLQQPDDSG